MIEALFPIVLPIHILTALVLIMLVILADKIGLAWILGKTEVVDAVAVRHYHRLINYGLVVSVITGAILFYPYSSYLFSLTEFRVKVSFILVLIVNGFVIGRFMETATKQSFRSLPRKQQVLFLLSGAISTTAWISVLIASYSLGL